MGERGYYGPKGRDLPGAAGDEGVTGLQGEPGADGYGAPGRPGLFATLPPRQTKSNVFDTPTFISIVLKRIFIKEQTIPIFFFFRIIIRKETQLP